MGKSGDSSPPKPLSTYKHHDYTVAWVCALEIELIAALEMLDETHGSIPQPPTDHNVYHLGSIAGHKVVIVGTAQAGNVIAAGAVTQMRMTFPNVRFGLLVGIGGGVPVSTEGRMIRLGHVVVSKPVAHYSGAIQYDRGKAEADRFVRTGALAPPPAVLLQAAQALGVQRARSGVDPLFENIQRIDTTQRGLRRFRFPGIEKDHLFPAEYKHVRPGATCEEGKCDLAKRKSRLEDGSEDMDEWITVHRGTIASGELVIKDGVKRDKLGNEHGILCFDMEAAGVLSDFPCLVVRGISDYCDSHKNDQWHGFAAAAAAAYARQLFFHMPITQVKQLISADDPRIERMIERSDDEERQRVAEWISSTNYAEYLADLQNERQENTGQWLLETTEFREWVKCKGVLYCPGMPGAGKTILSSIVINHLQESVGMEQNVGIAYIFFKWDQQSKQNLVSILRGILKQLVQTLPFMLKDVIALYKHCQRHGSQPLRDRLFELLITVCNCYSRVYLVMDALDECSDENRTRDKVISQIFELYDKCNISILITSRFIPNIAERFEPFPSVEIQADSADVRLFAEEYVNELSNSVRKDPELSEFVVSLIVDSVDGMFLLARLYLNSLKGKTSVKEIKAALRKILSESDHSDAYKKEYEKAMKRIEQQIADKAIFAKRVLSWLSCARRSLTLTELRHALAIEIDESSFDEDNLSDIEDMISVCAGLVRYHEKSHIISLVHYTAQEYFEMEWTLWFPHAHRDIGQACLTYVCYDVFASSTWDEFTIHDRRRQYPLYDYAAANWGYHAKRQSLGPPGYCLKLLGNDRNGAACALDTQSSGLHLATWFDLESEVEALLKQNRHPDITDSAKQTPLFIAVREGHEAIVKTLLRHDANPEFQDGEGRTPLSLAAEFGRGSLIDLFLKLGLSPNVTDKCGWSPLFYAAYGGHLDAVELLLDAQADVEMKDRENGMTALSWAAWEGHALVVVSLLLRGVQLDSTTPHKYLLHWAARHRFTNLIEKLLECGLDINQRDSPSGYTPLSHAVMNSHDDLAALLIEKGANLEYSDNFGRTPLFHGLERIVPTHGRIIHSPYRRTRLDPLPWKEFEDISPLLLGKDHDLLHRRDHFGRSPILLAAENQRDAFLQTTGDKREHSEIISTELEAVLHTIRSPGYDLSQDKGEFLLLWAAAHGHLVVIDFLLEKGISPSCQDDSGRTPFLLAAKNCHLEVIRFFINKGLISHVPDQEGYSPLSWAFGAENEVMIRLLLENGANPNKVIMGARSERDFYMPSELSGSLVAPLFLAVRGGHENALRFLLKNGADPNHFKYRADTSTNIEDIVSPFLLAVSKGYHGIVEAFLDYGANALLCHIGLREAMMYKRSSIVSLIMRYGIRDSWLIADHGESLLFHAASTGYIDVLRILLDKGVNPDSRKSTFISTFPHLSWPKRVMGEKATPLCCAAEHGHEAIALLLLARNADPNLASPLFWAMQKDQVAMVKILLQHGAKLNVSSEGPVLLRNMARLGNYSMTEFLLEKGVPLVPKDSGPLPLILAASRNYMKVIQVLLNNGANPNAAGGMGWTALFVAAEYGRPNMAELLIQHGAFANHTDQLGRTPLFRAVLWRNYDVARILLEKGNADPNVTTCAGRSPLSVAHDTECPEMAQLLSGKDIGDVNSDEICADSIDYSFYACCEICDFYISPKDSLYYCSVCDGNQGFDWYGCIECVEGGSGCYDELHTLEKVTPTDDDD